MIYSVITGVTRANGVGDVVVEGNGAARSSDLMSAIIWIIEANGTDTFSEVYRDLVARNLVYG